MFNNNNNNNNDMMGDNKIVNMYTWRASVLEIKLSPCFVFIHFYSILIGVISVGGRHNEICLTTNFMFINC